MMILPNTKCEMCKEWADECYLASNGLYLCLECMRKFNPPKMTLITYNPGGQTIYNIEVGMYERIKSVKSFEDCGWFQRSLQKSASGHVHRSIVNVHYFEYYGAQDCIRCKGYQYFDPYATKCMHEKCVDFAVKRKPEERNYPAKGSKYYEYIKNFKK